MKRRDITPDATGTPHPSQVHETSGHNTRRVQHPRVYETPQDASPLAPRQRRRDTLRRFAHTREWLTAETRQRPRGQGLVLRQQHLGPETDEAGAVRIA